MKAYEWALKMNDGVTAIMTKIAGASDKASLQVSALQNRLGGFEGAFMKSEVAATHFGSHIKSVFSEVKGYIAGAVGGYAAFEFGKDAVNAASAHLDAQAQIQRALKTTHGISGQTTEGMASQVEALNKTVLYKPEQLEAAQQQLLSFEHIRGKVFGNALKASTDLAAGLGKTLPDAIEIMGRALENPAAASKALRAAHIIMTKDQLKNISDLMAAGKQYKVQQSILNMVMERFGGAAKTAAETGMGPIEMMMKQWEAFKVKVGTVIIEFMTKHKPEMEKFMHSVESAITLVMNGIMKLFNFIESHWNLIKRLALIAGVIYGIVKAVEILNAIYKATILITEAATVAQELFNMAMTVSPIGTMALIVGGLVSAYFLLTGATDDATSTQDKYNDSLNTGISLKDKFASGQDEVFNFEKNNIEKLMSTYSKKLSFQEKYNKAVNQEKFDIAKTSNKLMDANPNIKPGSADAKTLANQNWALAILGSNDLRESLMPASDKLGLKARADDKGTGSSDEGVKAGINDISSGGKSVRNVNVRIESLVKSLNINATTVKESMKQIEAIVEEHLIRVVRGGEAALSNE